MSPENAQLVTSTITLCLLIYAYLLFKGKVPQKKKLDFIEKNKATLSILALLSMSYPVYQILAVIFKWK
jgi:hypothetical protein